VVAANILLGMNQGLAWTMTVTGKIDLVGPKQRGFAMGINEFSGYAGVSLGGFVGGYLGGIFGLRTAPFLFVLGVILVMLIASVLFVRETHPFTHLETQQAAAEAGHPHHAADSLAPRPSLAAIFALTTWGDRALAACSQAGLIEKFTDTLAWGLFPLYFASRGLSPAAIGAVVAAYTGTWAVLQIYTGHLTDHLGRKWPIAGGMWLAAGGIALVALTTTLLGWVVGAVLMGVGMALMYPTLLAAVSDVAAPRWRATSLGVYRLWRDSGYAIGALLAGVLADLFGVTWTLGVIAGVTLLSGVIAQGVMRETLPRQPLVQTRTTKEDERGRER
jgi:MFS family permease